jgi:hypothetical protein
MFRPKILIISAGGIMAMIAGGNASQFSVSLDPESKSFNITLPLQSHLPESFKLEEIDPNDQKQKLGNIEITTGVQISDSTLNERLEYTVSEYPWIPIKREGYFYRTFKSKIEEQLPKYTISPGAITMTWLTAKLPILLYLEPKFESQPTITQLIPKEIQSVCDFCQEQYEALLLVQETAKVRLAYQIIGKQSILPGAIQEIPGCMQAYISYHKELSPDLQNKINQTPEMQFLLGVLAYYNDGYPDSSQTIVVRDFYATITSAPMTKESAIAIIKPLQTEDAYWFREMRGLNDVEE